MPQRINPTRERRITELTRDGWAAHAIATELGVSTRTVVRYRHHAGINQPQPTRMSEAEHALAKNMFEDGASQAEVARTLRRSPTTLKTHYPDSKWTREQSTEHSTLLAQIKRKGFKP